VVHIQHHVHGIKQIWCIFPQFLLKHIVGSGLFQLWKSIKLPSTTMQITYYNVQETCYTLLMLYPKHVLFDLFIDKCLWEFIKIWSCVLLLNKYTICVTGVMHHWLNPCTLDCSLLEQVFDQMIDIGAICQELMMLLDIGNGQHWQIYAINCNKWGTSVLLSVRISIHPS